MARQLDFFNGKIVPAEKRIPRENFPTYRLIQVCVRLREGSEVEKRPVIKLWCFTPRFPRYSYFVLIICADHLVLIVLCWSGWSSCADHPVLIIMCWLSCVDHTVLIICVDHPVLIVLCWSYCADHLVLIVLCWSSCGAGKEDCRHRGLSKDMKASQELVVTFSSGEYPSQLWIEKTRPAKKNWWFSFPVPPLSSQELDRPAIRLMHRSNILKNAQTLDEYSMLCGVFLMPSCIYQTHSCK